MVNPNNLTPGYKAERVKGVSSDGTARVPYFAQADPNMSRHYNGPPTPNVVD
jgi:hypothetical protein